MNYDIKKLAMNQFSIDIIRDLMNDDIDILFKAIVLGLYNYEDIKSKINVKESYFLESMGIDINRVKKANDELDNFNDECVCISMQENYENFEKILFDSLFSNIDKEEIIMVIIDFFCTVDIKYHWFFYKYIRERFKIFKFLSKERFDKYSEILYELVSLCYTLLDPNPIVDSIRYVYEKPIFDFLNEYDNIIDKSRFVFSHKSIKIKVTYEGDEFRYVFKYQGMINIFIFDKNENKKNIINEVIDFIMSVIEIKIIEKVA